MLRNYFKIALRSLLKNSVYSFINIGGLAIGIACSVLIALWVWDETSYDSIHQNKDQLGQLYINNNFSDNVSTSQAVPLPTYEFLKTHDNRIKNTAVAQWPYKQLLDVDGTKITKNGQFVSPEFLEMFKFPFVSGSSKTAFKDSNSIARIKDNASDCIDRKTVVNNCIKTGILYVSGIKPSL